MAFIIISRMEPPSLLKCCAVKNRKSNCLMQCPNRRLGTSEFCGKHSGPYQLRYDILYQTHQATENNLGNQLINTVTNAINSIIPSSPNQNTTTKSSEKAEKRKRIWSIAQVCDKPPNEESRPILCKFLRRHASIDRKIIEKMSLEDLHVTSIRIYRIKREQAEIEKRKKILFKNGSVKPIQRIARLFLAKRNEAAAKLQSLARVRLTRIALGPGFYDKTLLHNEDDMCNSMPLNELKPCNFHSFRNGEIVYGVDCRSFDKLLRSGYNEIYGCKLSQDVIRRFRLRKHVYPKGNIDEEVICLTNEQQLNGKLVELVNLFDQYSYTDMNWFKNLSVAKLWSLYNECYEMWRYHFNASAFVRSRMLPRTQGHAFTRRDIRTINNKNALLYIIIDEMKPFLTDSDYPDDHRHGCWLLLTAICRVCPAANAELHLHFE